MGAERRSCGASGVWRGSKQCLCHPGVGGRTSLGDVWGMSGMCTLWSIGRGARSIALRSCSGSGSGPRPIHHSAGQPENDRGPAEITQRSDRGHRALRRPCLDPPDDPQSTAGSALNSPYDVRSLTWASQGSSLKLIPGCESPASRRDWLR